MNMQANMNKLVEQLTRVADALEKYNDLTVEYEERMRREQAAEKEQMRQERKAAGERMMQGLPPDDDRLLH